MSSSMFYSISFIALDIVYLIVLQLLYDIVFVFFCFLLSLYNFN